MQWNWENWRVGASKPLTANPRSSRRRRFRHHRADDHLIPFFQFTVHESRNFRIRMVRDSERDLHRLHAVIRVELPNNSVVGSRRARVLRRSARGPGAFRSHSLIARGFPFAGRLNPVLPV